jgi:hypothetical protein
MAKKQRIGTDEVPYCGVNIIPATVTTRRPGAAEAASPLASRNRTGAGISAG